MLVHVVCGQICTDELKAHKEKLMEFQSSIHHLVPLFDAQVSRIASNFGPITERYK